MFCHKSMKYTINSTQKTVIESLNLDAFMVSPHETFFDKMYENVLKRLDFGDSPKK